MLFSVAIIVRFAFFLNKITRFISINSKTTQKRASQLMQSLGRYYVMYINKNYQHTGTLWEGRYKSKSTVVDSEKYFLLVSRYIELNPVRANMVKHPAEYPWSSCQGKHWAKTWRYCHLITVIYHLARIKKHVNRLINICLNSKYLNWHCRKYGMQHIKRGC